MKPKKIVVGVLAHVDAGKTTLSEAMLYESGTIRSLGRVDNKDAFLDNNSMEKDRGITIFSKQAVIELEHSYITLLDTPGHVDFSTEMERTLQVLDYAILIISGADGIQGHTQTVWELLQHYHIPVFLFVNKMDQITADKEKILRELQHRLSDGCIDILGPNQEQVTECIAMQKESVLERYLETGQVTLEDKQQLVKERLLFPCFFGSALKLWGVKEFLTALDQMTVADNGIQTDTRDLFSAKVFKIVRDQNKNRLTYLKITGGTLTVKDELSGSLMEGQEEQTWQEKVNEIRIYSGERYITQKSVSAGMVCAVTGLNYTYPGQCFGAEEGGIVPCLSPVLTYQMYFPNKEDPIQVLSKISVLEEEDPSLHIIWQERLREIHIQMMGQVQIEILTRILKERFGLEVEFLKGSICYKETIKTCVEGVGHFEPLRHYAEVHLYMQPLPTGSGMVFESQVSEDVLHKNWQRLILTHLREKQHRGVLIGAQITDMKITLVAGRAHPKHTVGGDFRQATYRAVRQGLMEAESVLLEPFYEFRLELPEGFVGRAMTDIEHMHGIFETPEHFNDYVLIKGKAPVATFAEYATMVNNYTKGSGKLTLRYAGYYPCHNQEEVLSESTYDPEQDTKNPTGSVFCSQGAGFFVPWDQVKEHMHLCSMEERKEQEDLETAPLVRNTYREEWMDKEEVDQIIAKTFHANSQKKERNTNMKKSLQAKRERNFNGTRESKKIKSASEEKTKEYLLVDGYNVIFAWPDLKELAQTNIEGARGKLMDILCNYQGMKGGELILVFDAYRVQGHVTEILDYHNIHVVYTKEAETADAYIEKFAHENSKRYHITVATSDGLEQIIIRGAGCDLISSRELEEEVQRMQKHIQETYVQNEKANRVFLKDSLSKEGMESLESIRE